MKKLILPLGLIFAATSIAWLILGSTIFARTYSFQSELKSKVASSWGVAQQQFPPTASYAQESPAWVNQSAEKPASTKQITVSQAVSLPLQSSRVDVTLDLEHRQKGLLWYSTYVVVFDGNYKFTNDTHQERVVTFRLPFPAEQAIYDDAVLLVDNQPLSWRNEGNSASASASVPSGKTVMVHAAYRSQGLDSWHYNFGGNVAQVRDFKLHIKTNFKDIDFPDNTLSPTSKFENGGGWELNWSYKNLVSGYQIGLSMPEKLQPGPLAGQISYFAPVSLFFFFFLMFIITALRGIELHPMNYFFLAGAFFAFHLLLAYLVDHISIHLAFAVCSLVSIFLVISYLRLAVGLRFAALEAGMAQFVYLVLFSYAFFFKGFTGLAVTIGSIVTLFVVMQITGRIRWAEKFAAIR